MSVAITVPTDDQPIAEGDEAGFDRLASILGTRHASVTWKRSEHRWRTVSADGPTVVVERETGGFFWQASCEGVTLAVGETPGLAALLAAVEIAYQWLAGEAHPEAA
jgi:hypothetical protein